LQQRVDASALTSLITSGCSCLASSCTLPPLPLTLLLLLLLLQQHDAAANALTFLLTSRFSWVTAHPMRCLHCLCCWRCCCNKEWMPVLLPLC
jgi:hypothetical protein